MNTTDDQKLSNLTAWLEAQSPARRSLRIEDLSRIGAGHSAEMFRMRLVWKDALEDQSSKVVMKLRPRGPGMIEPYDFDREFGILKALENTAVKVPAPLWLESSGEVIGRPFYIMANAEGDVFEREIDPAMADSPARVRAMCEALIDAIIEIHKVDLKAAGLDTLENGADYLSREIDRWDAEARRVGKGPLPALEQLAAELRRQAPQRSPVITLVHGDPKPGNVAFVGNEISAVFDWELAGLGDPMADIGWLEYTWSASSFTALPCALSVEEFLARYEAGTGIKVHDRAWYRALELFKMAVILLAGAMVFEDGHSDDERLGMMGLGVPGLTTRALGELGVSTVRDHGPVAVSAARFEAARAKPKPISIF